MKVDFTGKTVLVTGGAGGVGSVCVKEFLEAGAEVAAADLSGEALDALGVSGQERLRTYVMDISEISSIKRTVQDVVADFGKIDILVQTAGILRGKSAFDITEKEWDLVLNINAKGLFFVMQEVVKQSMQHCGGAVINMASMAGIRGMRKGMESAHYSASKGAVVALTMQAATEWAGYGIRVNCLAPGGIRTPAMNALHFDPGQINPIPLGKLSEPEDISSAILFLASDHAAMITGQTLVIDGGSSIVGY